VRAGIAPLRSGWIEERNDTVELAKPSSVYRIGRESMAELDDIRFKSQRLARARARRERDADALRAQGHHHERDGVHRDS